MPSLTTKPAASWLQQGLRKSEAGWELGRALVKPRHGHLEKVIVIGTLSRAAVSVPKSGSIEFTAATSPIHAVQRSF